MILIRRNTTLAKTVTFAMVHFTVAFGVGYLLTGSVAIAGRQTGVYPMESPGGWRLIGRTPLRLFDPQRDPPAVPAPDLQSSSFDDWLAQR